MKKNIFVLLVTVLAFVLITQTAFSEGLSIDGEAKSGIFWQQEQQEGMDAKAKVDLHSQDDAGSGRGRYRLNLEYDNGKNFGMKARIQWETWSDTAPQWPYAFGYGNFFEDQLTLSVGKLGASPWGTGGPEMWKELEASSGGGMRTEWKPGFVPGDLNVGFVLSYFNSDRDQGWDPDKPLSLFNILRESVLGVSYSYEGYGLIRFAYRFDDEHDATQENKNRGGKGEDELVYRIEEHVLNNYVPGLQAWALGYYFGVSGIWKDLRLLQNWLFVQYEPQELGSLQNPFTAQIRFGFDSIYNRSVLHIKPSFYWNFFGKLISVGASFWYGQDFGDGKIYEGSPYQYIEFEPKVQLNFASSYVAFAFNFRQEYLHPWSGLASGKDPLKQTQWLNLRFCIYF